MYEGFRVQGDAETVLCRGRIIVEKGVWLGETGYGRFIRRAGRARW
jgi:dihydropyrimidinase